MSRQTAGCNVRTPGNGEELLQPCTAYYVLYDAKDFLLHIYPPPPSLEFTRRLRRTPALLLVHMHNNVPFDLTLGVDNSLQTHIAPTSGLKFRTPSPSPPKLDSKNNKLGSVCDLNNSFRTFTARKFAL